MHPIAKALDERGWTQQQLIDAVRKLKPRHRNGKIIKFTQGALSSVISDKAKRHRGLSVPVAKAIAAVLDLDAGALLVYERPAPVPPVRVRRSRNAA